MRGDQRNLKVQGIWVRLNSPTTRRSTPTLRIQSGMAIQTSPNGRPEEKLRSTTEAVRHDFMASTRLRYPESLFPGCVMPHKLGGDKPLRKSRNLKQGLEIAIPICAMRGRSP
jgi:hypothetical protein